MTRKYFAALLFGAALLVGRTGLAEEHGKAEPHGSATAEGTHAAHIGMAGADANLEKPEEVRPDLATFTFVVFLCLLAILWKFAWGPIVEALAKREHTIEEHIASAQRSHDEAKLLLGEYERKLAGATDEVRAIIEEARRDAEHTKQDILNEAKAGADAERARAVREIETATDHALKTLAERSADLAVELAGKIVQTKLTTEEHARLIQDAVARFPQGSPSQN